MTVTQLAMYGVGGATSPKYGLRFRDSFAAMYEENFGTQAPEGVLDTMESGAIESLFANVFDTEIAFSHRAGLGITSGGIAQLFTNVAMLNWEDAGQFDAASLSVIQAAWPDLYNLVSLADPSAETFGTKAQYLSALAIGGSLLRNTISSWSGLERAYLAYEMGMHVDKLGRTVDRDSSGTEIILGTLGLDPGNASDVRAMREALAGRSTIEDAKVKTLTRSLNLAMKTNELKDWDTFRALRKVLLAPLESSERYGLSKRIISNAKTDATKVQLQYLAATGITHNLNDKEDE